MTTESPDAGNLPDDQTARPFGSWLSLINGGE